MLSGRALVIKDAPYLYGENAALAEGRDQRWRSHGPCSPARDKRSLGDPRESLGRRRADRPAEAADRQA